MLLLAFWCGCLFAQDVGRQQFIDGAANSYLRTANIQSPLYYGKEQESYPPASNHPYFVDWTFAKARLSYSGVIYPEALLRLDINRDELIVVSPDYRQIVLFPENVDFAMLHGRHIIYFRSYGLPGSPSPGYYFLLYSGNCFVMEKQTAALILANDVGSRARYYFTFNTKYYLYKDGVYYNIRSQQGLLKALSPYKKELKRFISVSRLDFRTNPKEFLTRTVKEYENLSGLL